MDNFSTPVDNFLTSVDKDVDKPSVPTGIRQMSDLVAIIHLIEKQLAGETEA